jgi:hypothetical protein
MKRNVFLSLMLLFVFSLVKKKKYVSCTDNGIVHHKYVDGGTATITTY